jgi:hypothetical protein
MVEALSRHLPGRTAKITRKQDCRYISAEVRKDHFTHRDRSAFKLFKSDVCPGTGHEGPEGE